jgi:S1-C subfamily serine protease
MPRRFGRNTRISRFVPRKWLGILALGSMVALPGCGGVSTRGNEVEVKQVRATGCGVVDRIATGFRVDGTHVVTVAHTLRGAKSVRYGEHAAVVVALDHRTDIAVLRTEKLTTRFTPPALALPRVGTGNVVRLTRTDPAQRSESEVEVTKVAAIDIDEPIDSENYRRQGLVATLTSGAIEVGDSGSPVIDEDGAVIAMVFATGRNSSTSLFAVSTEEIESMLRSIRLADRPDAANGSVGDCDQ